MFRKRQGFGQVHATHFKNLYAFRLPGQIVGCRIQQAGQHGGPHDAELVADGIHQFNDIAAGIVSPQHHFIHEGRMNECISHYFVKTGGRKIILRFALHFFHGVFLALAQGQFRIVAFNFIVRMHTGDFFGNIRIACYILPPGRCRNHQGSLFFFHVKLQTGQDLYHFFFGNFHADAGVDGFRRNSHHCRFIGNRICVRNAADRFAGTHFFQQMGRTVQRPMTVGNVHAPFKAHGGFAAQAQGLGGPADGRTVKSRRFQDNGCSFVSHFRNQATHHAAQTNGLFRVRNRDHVGGQGTVLVVQGPEMFAGFCPADDEGVVFQCIVIVGVHRLAQFHHYVVGYVYYVVDGPHTAGPQFILHPVRGGHDLNIFQHPVGETAAQFRNLNFVAHHVVHVAAGRFLHGHVRHAHGLSQNRRRFPGNAGHAEAVLFVGGKINVQHRIVQA